jgi:hypothetical protein
MGYKFARSRAFQEEPMPDRKALLLIVAIALAGAATAQVTDHPEPPARHIVSFGFGPAANMIPAIKNAPFSAVLNSQLDQTLDDGTHINRENQEVVMRNSQGHIYRARTINIAGSNPHEAQLITLVDPSRHVEYMCTALKVCRSLQYRDPPGLRRPRGLDTRKDPNVTVEDLGTTDMNGVQVEGKRITRLIAEGTVGNDRPFTTVEEIWHSEQLDIDMQVKRTDPRMGTRTVTMTELSAAEPDAKYFEIPEGYRVEPMGIPTKPKPLEPFGPGGAEPGPRD